MDTLPVESHRRKLRLGCTGGLLLLLVLTPMGYVLIHAVFTPWAFFLGGHIHLLPIWHGIGHMKAASGDYVLYFWIAPAPSGRTYNFPYFRGWGYLCTPRGERYPLRVSGGLHEHTWIDTNGKEMHLELYRRPWYWNFTGTWDHRPRLDLRGRWQNPELVMNDGGTLSQSFLADGTLNHGLTPKPGEKLQIVFQEPPWTGWFADCRVK